MLSRFLVAVGIALACFVSTEGTTIVPCQTCTTADFSFDYDTGLVGTYEIAPPSTNDSISIEQVYTTYLGTDSTYGDIYGIAAFVGDLTAPARRLEEGEEGFGDALQRVAEDAVWSYQEDHPDLVKVARERSFGVAAGGSMDLPARLTAMVAAASAPAGNNDRDLADLPIKDCVVTSSTSGWVVVSFAAASGTVLDYPGAILQLATGDDTDIKSVGSAAWSYYYGAASTDVALATLSVTNCNGNSGPAPSPGGFPTRAPRTPLSTSSTPTATELTTIPTAGPTPSGGGDGDCGVCAYLQQQIALHCASSSTSTSTSTSGSSPSGGKPNSPGS